MYRNHIYICIICMVYWILCLKKWPSGFFVIMSYTLHSSPDTGEVFLKRKRRKRRKRRTDSQWVLKPGPNQEVPSSGQMMRPWHMLSYSLSQHRELHCISLIATQCSVNHLFPQSKHVWVHTHSRKNLHGLSSGCLDSCWSLVYQKGKGNRMKGISIDRVPALHKTVSVCSLTNPNCCEIQ